jgi:hypothetical protein
LPRIARAAAKAAIAPVLCTESSIIQQRMRKSCYVVQALSAGARCRRAARKHEATVFGETLMSSAKRLSALVEHGTSLSAFTSCRRERLELSVMSLASKLRLTARFRERSWSYDLSRKS